MIKWESSQLMHVRFCRMKKIVLFGDCTPEKAVDLFAEYQIDVDVNGLTLQYKLVSSKHLKLRIKKQM